MPSSLLLAIGRHDMPRIIPTLALVLSCGLLGACESAVGQSPNPPAASQASALPKLSSTCTMGYEIYGQDGNNNVSFSPIVTPSMNAGGFDSYGTGYKFTLTNNSSELVAVPYVVIAFYDIDGNIIAWKQEASPIVGLAAGNTIALANGDVPDGASTCQISSYGK